MRELRLLPASIVRAASGHVHGGSAGRAAPAPGWRCPVGAEPLLRGQGGNGLLVVVGDANGAQQAGGQEGGAVRIGAQEAEQGQQACRGWGAGGQRGVRVASTARISQAY